MLFYLCEATVINYNTIALPNAGLFRCSQGAINPLTEELYIADTNNAVIRKINADNTLSQVASGFFSPNSIAFTRTGDYYVADKGSHKILKVSGGNITIFAGTGTSGFSGDGGPASSAQINGPKGLAVYNDELYFVDTGNHVIRKIFTNQTISTIAGIPQSSGTASNGLATSVKFNGPESICITSSGVIYIADTQNSVVRKIENGTVSLVAGSGASTGDGGLATSGKLSYPSGIAINSIGELFISDTYNRAVRKVGLDGIINTISGVIGSFGTTDGLSGTSKYSYPGGISMYKDVMYVADVNNNRIRKVVAVCNSGYSGAICDQPVCNNACVNGLCTSPGVCTCSKGWTGSVCDIPIRYMIRNVAGVVGHSGNTQIDGPAVSSFIDSPYGAVQDAKGNVYLIEGGNSLIRKVYPNGNMTVICGNGASYVNGSLAINAKLNSSGILAIDEVEQSLYFGDANTIKKIVLETGIITTVASGSISAGIFVRNGVVYVANSQNYFVYKIENGVSTVVAGNYVNAFSGDGGKATDASVGPTGVYVDQQGNIYIADYYNSAIRFVNSSGYISTIVGTGASGYSGDGGPAKLAKLSNPMSVYVDLLGNIIIADSGNSVIRFVDAKSGNISTIAGNKNASSLQDDTPGISAKLNYPNILYVNSQNFIYYSDYGSSNIGLLYFTCDNNCNGNGMCVAANTCQCNSGWEGSLCSTFNCHTLNDCNGNGICASNNTCSCNSGWNGSVDCSSFSCENLNNCNGNGICSSNNTCTCQSGWKGSQNCSLFSCDSLSGCSNKGTCISNNTCVCNSGWRGSFDCSSPSCENLSNCNSLGICSSNNTCTCNSGWRGSSDCSSFSCEGMNNCNGNGLCISNNTCSCNSGWKGSNDCSTYSCDGLNNCNGNGICSSNNTCTCQSGWGSTNCFVFNCNGLSNCHGNGICSANNTCSCQSGWTGSDCSTPSNNNNPIPVCFGILANHSSVCSGKGQCVNTDTCQCSNNWMGMNCDVTTCYSVLSNQSSVCNGHGSCVTKNNCTCNVNYFTESCSAYCNSDETCNGHGICSMEGLCKCQSNPDFGYWSQESNCSKCQSDYFGALCQSQVSANARFSNDGKQVEFSLIPPKSYALMTVDCSKLLKTTDLPQLDSPVCKWIYKENGSFVIQLGESNSLQVGSVINVNSNVFDGNPSNENHLIPLTILAPLNPNKPIALISTSTESFSSCDSITIDAYLSAITSNDIYLKYQWQIITSPSLSTLQIPQLNASTLIFDASVPSGNYSVQLTVRNKFNQIDSTFYHFTKESTSIPQINVENQDIEVYVDRTPIFVKQFITFKGCNSNDTLSMNLVSIQWNQLEGPQTSYSKLPNNDMIINSFTDQTAQKYVFEVVLTFMNAKTSARVTINTIEPDYSILLYQSNINSTHVTINVEIDPLEILPKLNSKVWKWTCLNQDKLTNCDQSILKDLSYYSDLKSTLFTLKYVASSTIYLTLQIKDTIGDISVTFPKQDEIIPVVSLLSANPSKSLVKTSDILVLQLLISVNGQFDSIDSLIQREWRIDNQLISTGSSYLLNPSSDPTKSNFLSIKLSDFAEGSSHTLTCKVTSVSSKLSTVFSYTFNMATNPKPCYCSISPSTGFALDTLFSITCPNCLESDTSLQISFTDTKTGLNVPLMEATTITQSTIQLPYTGSSSLSIHFTSINSQTNAKTQTTVQQTILLPKANTIVEVKKKKSAWETFYKTLSSSDPRKIVFNYITTTVNAMVISLAKRKTNEFTCQNGGIFNSDTKMCSCLKTFKKVDCSMSISEWNQTTQERLETSQLLFDEFKYINQYESQTENKLITQISALYHLFENFDEINLEEYTQGYEIFEKQIQDAQKISYLSISNELSDIMSLTLNLMHKTKLSLMNGINSETYEQISAYLSYLSLIKFRNQIIGTNKGFETDFVKLTTTKLYPSELSNQWINERVKLPNMMTKYLKNVEMRKPLNAKLWVNSVKSVLNETSYELVTTDSNGKQIREVGTNYVRNADNILSLEIMNQVLEISQEEKVVSYYFPQFIKQMNDSLLVEKLNENTNKETITTSQIICLSDKSCQVQYEGNVFSCLCSNPSYVSISERSSVRVRYIPVSTTNKVATNNDYYALLVLLVLIPLIALLIAVPIVIKMKKLKKQQPEGTTQEIGQFTV